MKENQNIEWKQSWRDEYLKGICGFANADGGVMVIGRNDTGVAVGVKDARKLLVDSPNKVRDVLGVMVDVNLRREKGRELVEIRVEPYPSPVNYKGEYFFRSGSTNQMLKGAALDRFLLRKHGRTWDGAPLPGLKPADLDAGALQTFRRLALKSQRLTEAVLEEPDQTLLEKLHLVEAALREAVLNAVAHKDCAGGIPIQISVYRDKLMIWNPGELPPTWTIDKLLAKHASIPFNPDVANVF
jgi:ATP-dependent DNA helicase RecG